MRDPVPVCKMVRKSISVKIHPFERNTIAAIIIRQDGDKPNTDITMKMKLSPGLKETFTSITQFSFNARLSVLTLSKVIYNYIFLLCLVVPARSLLSTRSSLALLWLLSLGLLTIALALGLRALSTLSRPGG